MRQLTPEDKPKLCAVVNKVKDNLEELMLEAKERLEAQEIEAAMENDRIDVTMRIRQVGRSLLTTVPTFL